MPKLRKLAERSHWLSLLYNLPRLFKGYQPIFLDYPVRPVPRHGYGLPPHPELTALFAAHDDAYRRTLTGFLTLRPQLLAIPARPAAATEPCWLNRWLEGLDTLALYGLVTQTNPALMIEVGSGFSTKVTRRAIKDHQLRTRLVSIDPQPRAEIDALCDEVIRRPLEDCPLEVFAQLAPGDLLFIDGSHRSFMNSDVTVLFLEILPRLKPGVLVHLHDIYLPLDYPPDRAHWLYSEQYLLAASLLAGDRFEVVLPNHYVATTPRVACALAGLWSEARLAAVPQTGTSFWLRTR